jgi:hypothetical protein
MQSEFRLSDLCAEREVAKFLGVTLQSVRGWRGFDPPRGPAFIMVMDRAAYPIAALRQWAVDHPPTRTRKGFLHYPLTIIPSVAQPHLFDGLVTAVEPDPPEIGADGLPCLGGMQVKDAPTGGGR